jgi:hypothetical protein
MVRFRSRDLRVEETGFHLKKADSRERIKPHFPCKYVQIYRMLSANCAIGLTTGLKSMRANSKILGGPYFALESKKVPDAQCHKES